ncbi:MAG: hypothetical protein ACLQG3_17735 [Terracidiphilus sp.]
MKDETREYAIIIWPIEGPNGGRLVNLYATSVSGRPQIHSRYMGVKWAEVINKIRRLPVGESYDVDSIEGLLSKTPCDLHVHCTMRDLEAIGFIYS